MTALTDLLAKVEAGHYERVESQLKRYNDFASDIDAAGIPAPVKVALMDALHHGCAKYVLRALIAREEA